MKSILTNTNKKLKRGLVKSIMLLVWICPLTGFSIPPVANFSITLGTMCTDITYTITDMSSNSPTAWSYTIDDGFTPITVLSVQNPTFSCPLPFTYTITLECSNTSGTSAPYSFAFDVYFSPSTTLTPLTQTTCVGGAPINLNLTSLFGGFIPLEYQWSTGATTSSINVTPSVTTVFSCMITDTTTGCSETRSATITVQNASVSISSVPPSICPGVSAIMTASGTGPDPKTYLWSSSSVGASFATGVPGTYTVTLVNGTGCTATKTYSLANACVGIEELSRNETFVVYPNPSNGSITLRSTTVANIEIIDLSGKLIRTSRLDEENNYQAAIQDLEKGIYFVKSRNNPGMQGQKLIVNQ